jgi:hypothetical protein
MTLTQGEGIIASNLIYLLDIKIDMLRMLFVVSPTFC